MNYFKTERVNDFRGYEIKILKFLDVETTQPYFQYTISQGDKPIESSIEGFTWAAEAYSNAQLRVSAIQFEAMRKEPAGFALGRLIREIMADRQRKL